jgi:hypothetical protein
MQPRDARLQARRVQGARPARARDLVERLRVGRRELDRLAQMLERGRRAAFEAGDLGGEDQRLAPELTAQWPASVASPTSAPAQVVQRGGAVGIGQVGRVRGERDALPEVVQDRPDRALQQVRRLRAAVTRPPPAPRPACRAGSTAAGARPHGSS